MDLTRQDRDRPRSRPRDRHNGHERHRHAAARIAALDPLGANATLRLVPQLNAAGDVTTLTERLDRLLPPAVPETWGFVESAAAMRDLGIFLGSIRRHGPEPVVVLPALEPLLLELGRRTGLPPRDTLMHYTVWNPPGKSLRTYTPLVEERCLIESAQRAIPALEMALDRLLDLHELPIHDAGFAELADLAADSIRQVRDALVHAYRHVAPRVFVRHVRPFFEPITVGDQVYLGPGAVAMPLFIVDHLLWGSRLADPLYVAFKEEYLSYVLAEHRRLYEHFLGRDSLLDRLEVEMAARQPATAADARRVLHNLEQLEDVFKYLIRFRSPHLRLAEGAYEADAESAYDHGSGGYSPTILRHMLQLTTQAQRRLQRLMEDVRRELPVVELSVPAPEEPQPCPVS